VKVDEFTGYRNLHDAVARVLSAGTRRPAERDALRAYREVGQLLEEHLINGAICGQRAIARLAADLNLLPRPALRRIAALRLCHHLPAARGRATLQVQIELGFDVLHECRLRPPVPCVGSYEPGGGNDRYPWRGTGRITRSTCRFPKEPSTWRAT